MLPSFSRSLPPVECCLGTKRSRPQDCARSGKPPSRRSRQPGQWQQSDQRPGSLRAVGSLHMIGAKHGCAYRWMRPLRRESGIGEQEGRDKTAMAACRRRYGRHSLRPTARNETTLAHTNNGSPTSKGVAAVAPFAKQDRTDGLGDLWFAASGTENRSCCWRREYTNWRGHDDVMQIRSFRGLGEPAWVIAL